VIALRSLCRTVRNVGAGIVIAALIPVLIGRIVGVLLGLIPRAHWSRWRYRRALTRSGLTREEVEELLPLYDPRIPSLRQIFRYRRWIHT
jgi:hypothetical protein